MRELLGRQAHNTAITLILIQPVLVPKFNLNLDTCVCEFAIKLN